MKISRRGWQICTQTVPTSVRYARNTNLAIVTKDKDFQRLSVLFGALPKVIWVQLGNCSTADVTRLLRLRCDDINRCLADEEAAFLASAGPTRCSSSG